MLHFDHQDAPYVDVNKTSLNRSEVQIIVTATVTKIMLIEINDQI